MDEHGQPDRRGQGRGQSLSALRHGGADGAKPVLLAGLGGCLVVERQGHAAHAIRPADFHGEGVTLCPANAQSRRQPGLDQQDESHKAQKLGGEPAHAV